MFVGHTVTVGQGEKVRLARPLETGRSLRKS